MLLPLRDNALTWMIYSLLLVVLSAVLFGDVRHHLLGLDDANMFADNLAYDRDFTNFFSPSYERALGSGRPIADLVKYLAFKLWGNDASAYHLFTIALHTICALLLAVLVRRLGSVLDLSLITGLLFLANVTHFTAVHWINGLDYPLATLFGLLAIVAYIHGEDRVKLVWFPVFHIALLCGMMSHIAIVFVVPFCLYWSWIHGRVSFSSLLCLLPGVFSLALALAVSAMMMGSTTTSMAFDRFDFSVETLFELLRLTFMISGRTLSTAHWLPISLYQQRDWELVFGVIVLGIVCFVIWRKKSPLNLWGVWTLLALLPFLPVALVHTAFSRYLYMATVGTTALLAWVLHRLCLALMQKHQLVGRLTIVALAGLLVTSSYFALKRAEYISIYASAKYYLAAEDIDTGARLMRKAIDAGPETVDLIDAYTSLLTNLIGLNRPFEEDLARAQRDFPNDPNIQVITGAVYSMSSDSEKVSRGETLLAAVSNRIGSVQDEFNHVVETTMRNLGHRAKKRGEYGQAVRAYQAALHYGVDPISTLIYLGDAHLHVGSIDDAESIARRLLNEDPHSDPAHQILIRVLQGRGEWQKALDMCEERLRAGGGPDTYILATHSLWNQRKFDQALDFLESGMVLVPPEDREVYYLRWAKALRSLGRMEEAITRLDEGLAVMGFQSDLYDMLGQLLMEAGHLERAVEHYDHAIVTDPRNANHYCDRGTALKKSGRLHEARSAYESAERLDPQNHRYAHLLGELEVEMGNIDVARREFERALDLESNRIETVLALSRLHRSEGRHDRAVALGRRALEGDWPGALPEHYKGLGMYFAEHNLAQDAINAFQRGLQLDPQNANIRVGLGWILHQRGHLDKAIEQYNYILERGLHSVAQFNLSLAYLQKGMMQEARLQYAQAIEQYGAEEGLKTGAVNDLKSVVTGPNSATARDILQTYWP